MPLVPTLVRTNKLSQKTGNGYGSGDFTTSAFTPENNSLLVVAVYQLGLLANNILATDITLTDTLGSPLTYTSRYTNRSTAGSQYASTIRIFTAPVTTGQSLSLKTNVGGKSAYAYAVQAFSYTGYNTETPTGGTATSTAGPTNGAAQITLDQTPQVISEVLSFCQLNLSSGLPSVDPGTGWTEVYEINGGTTEWVMQTQARSGSESTSVDWNDVNVGDLGVFDTLLSAIEINGEIVMVDTKNYNTTKIWNSGTNVAKIGLAASKNRALMIGQGLRRP